MLIYGIAVDDTETSEDLTKILQKTLFNDKLGHSVSDIERCDRVGK